MDGDLWESFWADSWVSTLNVFDTSRLILCMKLGLSVSHLLILLHTSCCLSCTSSSLCIPPALFFPPSSCFLFLLSPQHNCLRQPDPPLTQRKLLLEVAVFCREPNVCVCVCLIVWAYADGRASESGRAASHPSAVITIFPSASSPSYLTWSSSGLNPDEICRKGSGRNVCLLHKPFFCVCVCGMQPAKVYWSLCVSLCFCVSWNWCVCVCVCVRVPPLPLTVSSQH